MIVEKTPSPGSSMRVPVKLVVVEESFSALHWGMNIECHPLDCTSMGKLTDELCPSQVAGSLSLL